MKHIPFAYVKKFSDSINTITDQAKVKLRAALMGVDLSDPQKARDEIAEIVERIVGASDAVAATMAAGFYDGIREYQTGEKLGALADSGREPDSTKRATYGITDRLAKAEAPDISIVEGLLVQRIGYEIQRSIGRTMYRNGQRDPNKPKFARVPTGGADSCEFCRMLASRGFAYNSERTAGKFNPDHYHDGCNCRVVCSWEDDPILDGFTPEEYDDKAWDTYGGDARSYASRDHSKHKQHQQEKRRNRYTDDGKLRAGYSGLRIDKQAAYTAADRKKTAVRAAAQRGNTQRGTKRSPKNAGVQEKIHIGKSVGAKARNFEVIFPDGHVSRFIEDSDIGKEHTFAGKGSTPFKELRVRDRLAKQYGGNPEDWAHVAGQGWIFNPINGKIQLAEVHWMQNSEIDAYEEFWFKGWIDKQ